MSSVATSKLKLGLLMLGDEECVSRAAGNWSRSGSREAEKTLGQDRAEE